MGISNPIKEFKFQNRTRSSNHELLFVSQFEAIIVVKDTNIHQKHV
uniref:Uncharacterized protein n=1 Tax=Rhizophora mucronata TaxID=61149 RepID=A0A2P2N1Q8_RHIMU